MGLRSIVEQVIEPLPEFVQAELNFVDDVVGVDVVKTHRAASLAATEEQRSEEHSQDECEEEATAESTARAAPA